MMEFAPYTTERDERKIEMSLFEQHLLEYCHYYYIDIKNLAGMLGLTQQMFRKLMDHNANLGENALDNIVILFGRTRNFWVSLYDMSARQLEQNK